METTRAEEGIAQTGAVCELYRSYEK
jgi:hypothetical protein